ncbi:MAG: YhdP family protein [Burkholderiales bacterium]
MSSFASKVVAACHRPSRWLLRGLRFALLLLAGVWLLVLGLWLVLYAWILPSADNWRPEIEAAATKAIGASVRIGRIEVRTSGWMPVVELQAVRLLDPSDREALRLPKVSATLSARSLLAWPPRLEQIHLHQPQLELRRDVHGQFWVAGLLMQPSSGAKSNAMVDWALRQHELAIEGGSLRWLDEQQADAEPLQLSQLQFLMRNSLRRHEWRLDATPPPELGQRLSLRGRVTQPLLARPGDWRRWSGLLYGELPQAHLAPLRKRLALPVALRQGSGSVRAWAELDRGKVREITLDLALSAVDLRLTPRVDPLLLESLSTRLLWQRLSDGSRWSVRGLQFALPANEPGVAGPWPSSNFTLSLRHAPSDELWFVPQAAALAGGYLQADRLDLGLMARIATALPLGEAVHAQLRQREPEGQVRSLEARWKGLLDAPSTWSMGASLEGLALQPIAAPEPTPELLHPLGQPGLTGTALRFSASERGGEAQLSLRNAALIWPGLLQQERLDVKQGQLQLRWERIAQGWKVLWPSAEFQMPDLSFQASGSWQSNGRPGGQLQLSARAPQALVRAVPRYLPQHLSLGTRQYLEDSLLGGQLRQLQLELKGPMAEFPFRAPSKGLFRLQAQLLDAQYAFVPSHPADALRTAYTSPWPQLDGVRGEIRLEGPGLRLRGLSGRTTQLELSGFDAQIDDMAKEPIVRVSGRWRGAVPEVLAYLRQTPIHIWTGEALTPAQGSGAVSGQLQLAVPLRQPQTTTVKGEVQLAGVSLRLRDDIPPFSQVRGPLSFTEKGLELQRLQARFLGGDVRVWGGSRGAEGLMLEAEGQASSDGLRAAREWPALATLAPALSGQADYQLRLQFKGAKPELELRSNLVGMASSWPEPLRKSATDSWPLLLRVQPQGDGREAWGLSLGNQLRALLEREGARTLRGAIRMGSEGPVVLPAQGVNLLWAAPRIDLDPWRARLARGGLGTGTADDTAWLPDRIQLETPELRVTQRKLGQVQLGLQLLPNRRDWRLQIKSPHITGDAEWRQPVGQPPQLQARLSHLALPQSEAQQVESLLDEVQSAQSPLPLLDLQVDDFELRGKRLGQLLIRADGADAGRDWTLQQLSLKHPDAQLNASGRWRAQDGRTQLDWQLDIENSGRWLDALGFTNTVRGGKGQLKGVLGWRGSPLSPSSAGLDGQLSIALDKGQFLRADPGVARLLGILSLQSLPRRLLFDWRDVFSGGFVFDEFAGDVRIQQGVAHTKNLRMRGLQANVLMEGEANLTLETTELKVLVVPNLDAGGATLAYTAINPAIGLTTFLAQLLLRKPIEAANTTHLRISGPWSDPKVEKIERNPVPPANPASRVSP